ncbi:MAG: serine hydrolase domain-containing protein [Candidatus Acidiferrales bacterium]
MISKWMLAMLALLLVMATSPIISNVSIVRNAISSQDSSVPKDLRELLEPLRKEFDLPALAAAIVTSHGLVSVGAVGVRKYGDATPVTVNDQFHLGSDTKAMTATLLAMYVEAGKLKWDTTLAEVFPELAPKMDPAYRRVTIDQLLAHRAGFTGETWPKGKTIEDMRRLPGTPREQRQAYLAMILKEPPLFPPGSQFLYSNRSYVVLGAMIERVANYSWERLMEERLFKPLGMKTCGFGAMGSPNLIDEPWQHTIEGTRHVAIKPGPDADNPEVIGPAGTVHCSIGDWAKFVQAHLRGEQSNAGILKPATFKRLHSPLFGGDYVAGWAVVSRAWAGGSALTHAGSNTQNFALVWVAPLKDFAVLVATNQAGGNTFNACDKAASTLILNYTATGN